ncbi:hypothetical protein HO173_007554 [Letharia columbiana]|uniref:Uncharacterized protein n=1 Tax=Letharia columbiana TaxID=112416 RepID=A0A8H6FSZ8_9LECA|nr:uncharacterized protein HO173_007554 [Letharia columbiana]KAF6234134.1 hypothetical protein HO173_007554 [Letharia columbiana]
MGSVMFAEFILRPPSHFHPLKADISYHADFNHHPLLPPSRLLLRPRPPPPGSIHRRHSWWRPSQRSSPLGISPGAIANFSGVNFLENLESAFFLEGLHNLTKWNTDHRHDHAIDVVTRVQAQELIHVQTAEGILKANGAPTFTPCKYTFPVGNADEFYALANIITSVGLGAVVDVVASLALTDPGTVQGPASILAIEARHDAFFRQRSVSDVPNPAPFDTRISAAYALNLAAPFIVKGSCAATPAFPVIPALTAKVTGKTTGSGGPIKFVFDTTAVSKKDLSKGLYIGWVNQANVVDYQRATVDGEGVVTKHKGGCQQLDCGDDSGAGAGADFLNRERTPRKHHLHLLLALRPAPPHAQPTPREDTYRSLHAGRRDDGRPVRLRVDRGRGVERAGRVFE